MRRDLLAPARAVVPAAFQAVETRPLPETYPGLPPIEIELRLADAAAPPVGERLREASPAEQRKRHLFHPKKGWFRRLERNVSQYLGKHAYPKIPGLHLPYDWQLRRSLSLSEGEIMLRGLPRPFDGTRLLLISDIHAGPFISPRVLREVLERLQSLEPDVIVIAGDLTTAQLSDYTTNREAFRRLHAPLGVYAVLGNHDHYTEDPRELARMVEEDGIRMLHNESVRLRRDRAELSLAGVDDLLMGRPDLNSALRDACGPVILLSHNPDLFFQAAERDVGLMLSGHTHAGQIRVPGLPVLVRQSRYRLDSGRYRFGATELVVSRGIGAVGLPLRAACSPEAVLLHLRCS